MTLKEKFWNIIKKQQTDRPIECEQIADEFAIGFAEWCDDNYFRMGRLLYLSESTDWDNNIRITTKELLEIYKKEKGL